MTRPAAGPVGGARSAAGPRGGDLTPPVPGPSPATPGREGSREKEGRGPVLACGTGDWSLDGMGDRVLLEARPGDALRETGCEFKADAGPESRGEARE